MRQTGFLGHVDMIVGGITGEAHSVSCEICIDIVFIHVPLVFRVNAF